MRRLMLLAGVMVLLIVGGGLTSFLLANGTDGLIPVLDTTSIPEASVNVMTPNQAVYFLLVVGFILFNLIGAAVTIALIVWFLSREVVRAKAMPARSEQTALTAPNTSTGISTE